VTTRRGASRLGCLFTLLILAVVIYFGGNIGQAYWRYYQFVDDMRQHVRFAAHTTDDQILKQLQASADSLGLPETAKRIAIRRTEKAISVEADYYEHIELPLHVREFHFHPHAEGPL